MRCTEGTLEGVPSEAAPPRPHLAAAKSNHGDPRMYRGLKISVVIPCYNEQDGIRSVIEAMPTYVDEIVVVDNNSTDRTGEIARNLGAVVVFQPRKGYGAAYQAGLPAATGDVIATLDGDGTYPADEIG